MENKIIIQKKITALKMELESVEDFEGEEIQTAKYREDLNNQINELENLLAIN